MINMDQIQIFHLEQFSYGPNSNFVNLYFWLLMTNLDS